METILFDQPQRCVIRAEYQTGSFVPSHFFRCFCMNVFFFDNQRPCSTFYVEFMFYFLVRALLLLCGLARAQLLGYNEQNDANEYSGRTHLTSEPHLHTYTHNLIVIVGTTLCAVFRIINALHYDIITVARLC